FSLCDRPGGAGPRAGALAFEASPVLQFRLAVGRPDFGYPRLWHHPYLRLAASRRGSVERLRDRFGNRNCRFPRGRGRWLLVRSTTYGARLRSFDWGHAVSG